MGVSLRSIFIVSLVGGCIFVLSFAGCKESSKESTKLSPYKKQSISPNVQLKRGVSSQDIPEIRNAVKAGADVNQPLIEGLTPLMITASGGTRWDEKYVEMIHVLCELGAQTEIGYQGSSRRFNQGMTALMIASRSAQYPLVEALLEKGASPNTVDDYGYTSLHWACDTCNTTSRGTTKEKRPDIACTKVVQLLIAGGADLAPGTFKTEPIDLAEQTGNWETVAALLDAGAKAKKNLVLKARHHTGRDESSWQTAYEEEAPLEVPVVAEEEPSQESVQEEPPF